MDEKQFIGLGKKTDCREELKRNLEAARKEKAETKLKEYNSIIIQRLFRCFIEVRKAKKTLIDRLTKRLSDLVQVEKQLNDPQFALPLQIMNDFLRDFNYLLRKHFVPKNKYADRNQSSFNQYAILLDKISYWLSKSLVVIKKQKDNIFTAFYSSQLHQSSRRKLKNDKQVKIQLLSTKPNTLQDRSFVNLSQFIRLSLIYFSTKGGITWKENLQNSLSSFFSKQTLENAIKNSSNNDNLKAVCLFQDDLFIYYDIYSLLQFQITQMIVRNAGNGSIEAMIEMGLYPIKFFYEGTMQKDSTAEEKAAAYSKAVKFQSEFVTKIISIPRVAQFAIAVECKVRSSIPHLNWKNLFKSFLYSNISDPLSEAGEKEFIAKFSSKPTEIINLFGNCIRILKDIIDDPQNNKNDSISQSTEKPNTTTTSTAQSDYFSVQQSSQRLSDNYFFLKLMSYCLNMITPSWFAAVLTNYSLDDREVIALGESVNLLFEKSFAIRLCSAAFEQDFVNSTAKQTIGERFNPEVGNMICELYSKILAVASKSEQSQKLTFKILSALAHSDSLIQRLLSHINTFFGGIDALTNGSLSSESYNSCVHVFILLVVSFYNQLSIIDYQDFFADKSSISPKQLPPMIIALIRFNFEILQQSSPTPSALYLAFQSSKLLKLLREFDRRKELMPEKNWQLQKSEIQTIMQQVEKFEFAILSVVRAMPFCVPFDKRFEILSLLIKCQKYKNDIAFRIIVRRNNIFGDGFEAFRQIRQVDLQAKLHVYYIDEFGQEERGIDAGGIFKEFINDLSKIVFDPNYGMFVLAENNEKLHPNQDSEIHLGQEHLEIFHFLGSVVGRAIYDKIIIGPVFSIFFLRQMIGKLNNLVELERFDKELYKNLKFLKEYTGNAADLSLTFSIVDHNQKEISLIPNGKNIPVDNSNLIKYIYLVADWKMNKCIQDQTKAFVNGLTKVIPKPWLQMFDETEMQVLISGDDKGINIQDLKANTQYEGGYSSWDFYIRDFWKVVAAFTEEEKVLLLKFVTSCERQPLLGFKNLLPNFTINKISSEGDTKLPHSSTCFNKLNLPKYSSEGILKSKLLLAIKSAQGFYLS